jgi:hypothetical protein
VREAAAQDVPAVWPAAPTRDNRRSPWQADHRLTGRNAEHDHMLAAANCAREQGLLVGFATMSGQGNRSSTLCSKSNDVPPLIASERRQPRLLNRWPLDPTRLISCDMPQTRGSDLAYRDRCASQVKDSPGRLRCAVSQCTRGRSSRFQPKRSRARTTRQGTCGTNARTWRR